MTFREDRLFQLLVRLADTLVSDFDVADLLADLVTGCKELLDVDQVGLLLTDGSGVLRVAAASSEATHVVELLELENDGGPGNEAFRTGSTVGGELSDGALQRWPEFGRAAIEAGFRYVIGIPMRLRQETLGAVNLFTSNTGGLTDHDLTVARALADLATIAILQDRSSINDRALIAQLQTALESRVVIEQAKGIVAQEADLDMDSAFARLRTHARNHNERLRDVAARVVSGDLPPGKLIGDI